MQKYVKFINEDQATYLVPFEKYDQDISDYYESIKNKTNYFKKLEEGETGWIFIYPPK